MSDPTPSPCDAPHGERLITRAAVLGAGVMGAQIAAHLANAGLEVLLYDLPAATDDAPPPSIAALTQLRKADPAPLAATWRAALITALDYDHDLERLSDCQLIIEAIAERADLKIALYQRILPYLGPNAVLASNTSGLGIALLSAELPPERRRCFCGIHFFNPPRYMRLVELIAGPDTDAAVLDTLETFLVRVLGKSVVRAKDSPNFIANRVGLMNLLGALQLAERLGLAPDLVDALTGVCLGRPKTATFRTLDLVGLDLIAHVLEDTLEAQQGDPWLCWLVLPNWVQGLIERGALGKKSGGGVYRKQDGEIQVFDPTLGDYRPLDPRVDPQVQAALNHRDWGDKLSALRELDHPQAHFVWALMRTVMLYSAHTLAGIADNARDLDLAMRWGFGWKAGPFEIWQAAGWLRVREWIAADVRAAEPLAEAPLPSWVHRVDGVHLAEGSYSPSADGFHGRSRLPVYASHLFPDRVLCEVDIAGPVHTVFEGEAARLWHQDDGIAILSLTTKMHAIGSTAIADLLAAIDAAESDFDALVLWQSSEPFCAGANLLEVAAAIEEEEFGMVDEMISHFQQMTTRLRYSAIPTIAAVRGLAIGGGCELVLHCDRAVATLESYIGLVESGVGVIPAGGGCRELARRAHRQAPDGNPWPQLAIWFETVAMATASRSAEQAQELGFLRPSDRIIMHPDELLYAAKAEARALAADGYRPPPRRPIRVAGRTAIANFQTRLVNLREGGFISVHDFHVARLLADALCGGNLDPGTEVDEDWYLELERMAFLELVRTEKTYDRIVHTLQTGKPLRN